MRRETGFSDSSTRVLRWLAVTLAIAAASSLRPALAQEHSAQDPYQRSLQIYEFKKAAASGPDRGQEIFYYKCWFCHNEFTKEIPKLPGLFQRPTLVTGAPVNEETVKNQIRNGSANMAAYKYTLSEADLNDLFAYLREKCCWNSDAPPLNPRYIAR